MAARDKVNDIKQEILQLKEQYETFHSLTSVSPETKQQILKTIADKINKLRLELNRLRRVNG